MRSVLSFSLILSAIALFSCGDAYYNDGNTSNTDSLEKLQVLSITYQYSHGKSLFKKYCNTCHVAPEIYRTDSYTFDKLFERLPAPADEYFVKYVGDTKRLKGSGDQYAIKVAESWGVNYNHTFKDSLSQQDFASLVMYIKIAANQKTK